MDEELAAMGMGLVPLGRDGNAQDITRRIYLHVNGGIG